MEEQLENVIAELDLVGDQIENLLQRQETLLSEKKLLEQQLRTDHAVKQSRPSSSTVAKKETDWASTEFPWSRKVNDALNNVFHIDKFRSLQLECINATMSGVDCILIMPTGGGKSLCFQLPAVVSKGFTLVISPLVSLMEDQLMALEELKINAQLLNASSSREHVNKIHAAMVDGNTGMKMLYVTPEKISKNKRFMAKLEKAHGAGQLSRVVIDEVHCTSQWGHDFRPDYKILGILKRQFPTAPILGLTATATTKVIEDCKSILSLKADCILLKASFNRPNLYYEVRLKQAAFKDSMNELAELILTRFPGQSGIVYCFSRKDTEEVSKGLNERGVKSGFYHAYMEATSRSRMHVLWTKNKLQVVVATVAFGMGIDKPDVRFVIHHSLSKSMENFYQESGRAGRDDKRADCILYYRPADASKQSAMVFVEQTGLENLYNMLKYCQDQTTCRRTLIGRHFGEFWDDSKCNRMCDHCNNKSMSDSKEVVTENITKHCVPVLRIINNASSLSERVTANKVVDSWRGCGQKNLRVQGMQATKLSREECEMMLIHMLIQGVLREDFHFTPYSSISYLLSGALATTVLNGNRQVTVKTLANGNPLLKTTATLKQNNIQPESEASSSSKGTTQTRNTDSKKKCSKLKKTKPCKEKSDDSSPPQKKMCKVPQYIDSDDDDIIML